MARIVLSPLATSISGRQGGVTFRMTRHGPVMQRAQDTPVRLDSASVAVKARFAAAVHAWSVMPAPQQDALQALQADAGHGSPGPWTRAWSKYALLGAWDYPYATEPTTPLKILWTGYGTGVWAIMTDHVYAAPWTHARILIFNPSGGLWSRHWHWRPFQTGTGLIYAEAENIPAGYSALVLPYTADGSLFRTGDAHEIGPWPPP